jgi:hypothetical protein
MYRDSTIVKTNKKIELERVETRFEITFTPSTDVQQVVDKINVLNIVNNKKPGQALQEGVEDELV